MPRAPASFSTVGSNPSDQGKAGFKAEDSQPTRYVPPTRAREGEPGAVDTAVREAAAVAATTATTSDLRPIRCTSRTSSCRASLGAG